MNSFINNILEKAKVTPIDDDPVLQRLCEEVIFWQEYTCRNQNRTIPADTRTQNALNYALQRLKSYLYLDDQKTINLRSLSHVKLPNDTQHKYLIIFDRHLKPDG